VGKGLGTFFRQREGGNRRIKRNGSAMALAMATLWADHHSDKILKKIAKEKIPNSGHILNY